MSDVFSRLADRALERAPRVRPQITPRYARPGAPMPVEEIDAELQARPATPRRERERPELAVTSRTEAPRHAPVYPDAPRVPAPDAAPAPRERTVTVEPAAPVRVQQTSSAAERSVERLLQSVLERTQLVETTPLAAAPVALRPADAAAVRPSENRRAPTDPPRLASVADSTGIAGEPHDGAHDFIQVTIGRIDVRATRTAPPAPAPPRVRQAPMGLDEYLRRRNEER